MGAAYMPMTQELELGVLHFPITRILVTVGFLRAMSKGERVAGGMNTLDRLMILWAVWAVISSVFHASGELVTRLGMVYTTLGTYYLFRVFVQDTEDVYNVFKIMCIVFVPVALSMLMERFTGKNSFDIIGAPSGAVSRHGKFRAQGPFAHAIMAGNAGAACLPMALLLWREHRKLALTGIFASCGVIFASGSSGPVMMAITILLGMGLWNYRNHLKKIRLGAVIAVIVLSFVMKDPVYYLIARIDITGGSTGWHRAALIDGAIRHFSDWCIIGTDYTRNWMPTGVYFNPNHTDITNHYLQMGVWGGMPLMLMFMAVMWAAFVAVGKALEDTEDRPVELQFLIWTLGAMLFGHATNFVSACYFDQTVVFIYILLANIGSLQAVIGVEELESEEEPVPADPQYEADLCHNS